MSARILRGDCRELLRALPDASVHCVVTSPPYWGLRDYGVDGQIGLEAAPSEYVDTMVEVFREVWRVLRPDGTVWLNLGDTYATRPCGDRHTFDPKYNGRARAAGYPNRCGPHGVKHKDLVGIPWRVALALQDDGWWLRQDNIWAKRNCMPESVRDRTTRAHEYMFMLTRAPRYFYDATAIEEDGDYPAGTRAAKGSAKRSGKHDVNSRPPEYAVYSGKRNKRSVWHIATQPFAEAHFATFPPDLIEPCIKAGTSERGCCRECGAPWLRQLSSTFVPQQDVSVDRGARGAAGQKPMDASNTWEGVPRGSTERSSTGWLPSCRCDAGEPVPCTVLDPFGGAGTTGLVADRLQRDAVLIELNSEYADMAERRLMRDAGLFAEVAA